MPVHLFGLCADMDAVRGALPDGTPLVEDAACAVGGGYRGRPAGGLGDVAAFSFHPRKSITTGEGGMVTTDDADLDARVDRLRNHGAQVSEEKRHSSAEPYLLPAFEEMGFNYRMTDLQAAVGRVQLTKLDQFVAERDKWARWYMAELADLGWLRMPAVPEGYDHAWQAFVTVVGEDAPMDATRSFARSTRGGSEPGPVPTPSPAWASTEAGASTLRSSRWPACWRRAP